AGIACYYEQRETHCNPLRQQRKLEFSLPDQRNHARDGSQQERNSPREDFPLLLASVIKFVSYDLNHIFLFFCHVPPPIRVTQRFETESDIDGILQPISDRYQRNCLRKPHRNGAIL